MKEKFIKQIMKLLTCSKKRKEEIKQQLVSDIDAAVASGEKEEDVIKRMGKAEEIANAFNQSFSREEVKIYKKELRKRRALDIVLVMLVIAFGLWWMMPKNKVLEDSDRFQTAAVEAQAKEVVQMLDDGDYDGIRAMAVDKLAPMINEEEMEHARNNLAEDWGELSNYGNIYMIESVQRGQHSAVVQMNISYENTSVTYTISFDKNMKLNGLWMK